MLCGLVNAQRVGNESESASRGAARRGAARRGAMPCRAVRPVCSDLGPATSVHWPPPTLSLVFATKRPGGCVCRAAPRQDVWRHTRPCRTAELDTLAAEVARPHARTRAHTRYDVLLHSLAVQTSSDYELICVDEVRACECAAPSAPVRAGPCRAVRGHAVPVRAVPCRAVPVRAGACCAGPCCAVCRAGPV